MRGRQISKRAVASLGGIIMEGLWTSPPVIGVGPCPGDRLLGHPCLSIPSIAAAVIQMARILRQGGGRSRFSGYMQSFIGTRPRRVVTDIPIAFYCSKMI
ncbi:hypothetical protein AVEN_7165-1 [Araneus ventricosus]|uniref:Uncharacterized protein n=1 Tax=Araneus ventricosus TaxID=182803 RepID=A0A4Y2ILP5_ARAVE|nr:hypothetical protein AVEN_7165-1 [Araneus ventricosus]